VVELESIDIISMLESNRNLDNFYSAHKSEVAGTSLFTGAYPEQNRQAAGQIQRVRQADGYGG